MVFHNRLKEKRLERGFTQQEIADKLKINRVTYTNWEKGNREPNLENIVKLAEILQIDTDYLLGKTVYPRQDWQPLVTFDLSDIKNFNKEKLDKLKFSIMFEITSNKIKALELKNNLIIEYKLDETSKNIMNTIFKEVVLEMKEYYGLS